MKNNNFMKKTKLFFSLDKELKYINEMNKAGWKLVYIKCGCAYYFEKCEPDKYFTIMHSAPKEKVMDISAFAAQCGFQSIPHTTDGFGDLIYLTGKKAEVSPEFVCEAPEKIDSAKRIYKRFRTLSIVFILATIFLVFEGIFFVRESIQAPEASAVLTVIGAIFMIFIGVYIAMCVYVNVLTAKARKNLKKLQNESEIYE